VTLKCALAAAALAGLAAAPAWADGKQAAMTPEEIQKAQGVTQQMQLGGLNLALRNGYQFIPAADVSPILQQLNAPPSAAPVLGAVVAEKSRPGDRGYWISVITEDPIGHVMETGGDEIGSMTFLDSVKKARPASPALTAFAVTPAYAREAKTLLWAEKFDAKPPTPDLRHEQRLLGRNSVAGVTTIGAAKSLKGITGSAKTVMAMLSFAPGKAYGDFSSAVDRVSEYDLPGLITGKRKAGPMADAGAAAPNPAPAPAFALADLAPGGKLQWAPWLGGGIVALGGVYLLISALRRRSSGIDYTAQERDGQGPQAEA